MTSEDLSNMISRLSVTNTTTAMKATLNSSPRYEFEYYYRAGANLKCLEDCRFLYEEVPVVTPPTCSTPEDVDRIVTRLGTPTTSQRRRAEASMNRRRVIEEHKAKMWQCDVASQRPKH